MTNLNTFGTYKIGFKRVKAACGNSCLVFYPVDQSNVNQLVPAHGNVPKVREGYIKAGGLFEGMMPGHV